MATPEIDNQVQHAPIRCQNCKKSYLVVLNKGGRWLLFDDDTFDVAGNPEYCPWCGNRLF